MIRPIIYPYNLSSKSAKVLSESLSDVRCKRVREDGKYSYRVNHIIINWGNPRIPNWLNNNNHPLHTLLPARVINCPNSVSNAQNKLVSFELMHDKVRIPTFTTLKSCAKVWIEDERVAVARTLLRGYGGRGI